MVVLCYFAFVLDLVRIVGGSGYWFLGALEKVHSPLTAILATWAAPNSNRVSKCDILTDQLPSHQLPPWNLIEGSWKATYFPFKGPQLGFMLVGLGDDCRSCQIAVAYKGKGALLMLLVQKGGQHVSAVDGSTKPLFRLGVDGRWHRVLNEMRVA